MITQTVTELRDNLADLIGKVQHGGENVTILKSGKPVVVMISLEEYEYLERMEDEELARMAQDVLDAPGYDPKDVVPHDQVWAEVLNGFDKE